MVFLKKLASAERLTNIRRQVLQMHAPVDVAYQDFDRRVAAPPRGFDVFPADEFTDL